MVNPATATLDAFPAVSLAVIATRYRPGLSALLAIRPLKGTTAAPAGKSFRVSVPTVFQRLHLLAPRGAFSGLTHAPRLRRPGTGFWILMRAVDASDSPNLSLEPRFARATTGVARGPTRNALGPNAGRPRTLGAVRSPPPPPPSPQVWPAGQNVV